MVRYLFENTDTQVFFSRRICQDPLEKFFGCQRQISATNNNITVEEFQKNTQALRIVNSFCRGAVRGNCRGNEDLSETQYHMETLPRRSSASKHKRAVDEKIPVADQIGITTEDGSN